MITTIPSLSNLIETLLMKIKMHLTVVVHLVVMLIANGVFVKFTMMKFKYIHL